ncbi:MAG: hypothetical protein J6A04_04070 [Clostridia bacterium]|nr:hypothetical protein [Clostridia bacterium]
MNRLFLMKNPDLFQGEKKLNTNKNYFEGWYFKNTNHEKGISFIPGINVEENKREAFIQVITNNSSYFIHYPIDDFKCNVNPFYIQIGDNTFSKDGIHIDVKEDAQNLNIYGNIQYSKSENISTSALSPNIMGPFSYIPFMECNHAILSMQNDANGFIDMNHNKIKFHHGVGYIEKDWGTSFPKSYIWCQANHFQKPNTSFMLSVADIPFSIFTFRGIICVLIIDNQEYKFTTYNNAKLIEYDLDSKLLNITLKKGPYRLNITSTYDTGLRLSAPVKGKMEKDIFESISSSITVNLKKNNRVIFSDTSTQCGIEIVPE